MYAAQMCFAWVVKLDDEIVVAVPGWDLGEGVHGNFPKLVWSFVVWNTEMEMIIPTG